MKLHFIFLAKALVLLLFMMAPAWVFCQTPVATLADSTAGLHFNVPLLNIWFQRADGNGPYKTVGDAGLNTPGDWSRITAYKDMLMALQGPVSSFPAGNDGNQNLIYWTGYTGDLTTNTANTADVQMPKWQGVRLEEAAFWSLVMGRSTSPAVRGQARDVGMRVKDCLLYQASLDSTTGTVFAAHHPRLQGDGFFEASWVCRLLFAFDYTKHRFTSAERDTMEAWFLDWARVVSRPVNTRLNGHFVNRWTGNYGPKTNGNIADPNLSLPKSSRFLYDSVNAYNNWSNNPFAMLYRDGTGAFHDTISRLSIDYTNRFADRMNLAGQVGMLFKDDSLIKSARLYATEWMRFCVWPDMAISEWQRNGDVNISRGVFYGFLNIQQFVLLAYSLDNWLGDKSLLDFETDSGRFHTEVPVGEPKKSIGSVMKRYGLLMSAAPATSSAIYTGPVDPSHRSWHRSGPEVPPEENIADQIFSIANAYYKDDILQSIYTRNYGDLEPYPGDKIAATHNIQMPYGGPSAILPGTLFMFGQMEDSLVNPARALECGKPLSLSATPLSDVTNDALLKTGLIASENASATWIVPPNDEDENAQFGNTEGERRGYQPSKLNSSFADSLQFRWRRVGFNEDWHSVYEHDSTGVVVKNDALGFLYEANVRKIVSYLDDNDSLVAYQCPWSKPTSYSSCNMASFQDIPFVKIEPGQVQVRWNNLPIAWLDSAGMYGLELRYKISSSTATTSWFTPFNSTTHVPDDTTLTLDTANINLLTQEKTYYVQIRKLCIGGQHSRFERDFGSTNPLPYSFQTPACPLPVFAAIENRTATSLQFHVIPHAFGHRGTDLTLFRIGTGTPVQTVTLPTNQASYTFSGLTTGERYYVQYRTRCDSINYSVVSRSDTVPLKQDSSYIQLVEITEPRSFACADSGYALSVSVTNPTSDTIGAHRSFRIAFRHLTLSSYELDTVPLTLPRDLLPGQTDTLSFYPFQVNLTAAIADTIFLHLFDDTSALIISRQVIVLPHTSFVVHGFEDSEDVTSRFQAVNGMWRGYEDNTVNGTLYPEEGDYVAVFEPKNDSGSVDYFQSPCLDLSDTTDLLSFYMSDLPPKTDNTPGFVSLEVSLDRGETFTRMHILDVETSAVTDSVSGYSGIDPNPDGRWHEYRVRFDSLFAAYPGNKTVQLRFKASSEGTMPIGLDTLTWGTVPNYAFEAVQIISPSSDIGCISDSVPVIVKIHNSGTHPIPKYEITVFVSNARADTLHLEVTDNDTLLPGQTVEVLVGYLDMRDSGQYHFEGFIDDGHGMLAQHIFPVLDVVSDEFSREAAWHIEATPSEMMVDSTFNLSAVGDDLPRVAYRNFEQTAIHGTTTDSPIINPDKTSAIGYLKSVMVNLYHPHLDSVQIDLFTPWGTYTLLSFGQATGTRLAQTVFDDDAALYIYDHDAVPPYRQRYRPTSSLSGLGVDSKDWKLIIYDVSSSGGSGQLYSWGIAFENISFADSITWASSPGNPWSINGAVATSFDNLSTSTGGDYLVQATRVNRNGCTSHKKTEVHVYDAVWLGGTADVTYTDFGNWHLGSNWSSGTTPADGATVKIPATAARGPVIYEDPVTVNSMLLDQPLRVENSLRINGNVNRSNPSATAVAITNPDPMHINFGGTAPQRILGRFDVEGGFRLGSGNGLLNVAAPSQVNLQPGATIAFHTSSKRTLSVDKNASLRLRSTLAATARLAALPDSAHVEGKLTLDRQIQKSPYNDSPGAFTHTDWHFVGMPFADAPLAEWSEAITRVYPENNATVFRYTENNIDDGVYNLAHVEYDGWKVAYHSNDSLVKKPANRITSLGIRPEGYRLSTNGTFFDAGGLGTLSAKGMPIQHEVKFSYTHTPDMWLGGGYNLVANPYPSEIDWNKIRRDGENDSVKSGSSFYIWNPMLKVYSEYNPVGESSPGATRRISSMQSFFISANQSSILHIKESHKSTSSEANTYTPFFREGPESGLDEIQRQINRMEIRISSNPDQGSGYCVLKFVPGGNRNYVQGEDQIYLDGAVNFQTLSADGEKLFSNVYPEFVDRDSIAVRISLPVGQFTVRFDSLESFPQHSRFFLKDTRVFGAGRDSIQDLLANNVYTFSYTGTPYRADLRRFKIIVVPPAMAVDPDLPAASATLGAVLFPNPATETLNVRLVNGRGRATYQVIAATGVVAMKGTSSASSFAIDVKGLSKGMYLIRIEDGERTVTKRFVRQ